jgi:hypothetical protein
MIRGNQIVFVVALAAAADVAGVWACQNDVERFPRAGCNGEDCPIMPPFSGGGTAPRLDTGLPDVPADAVAQLSGTVQVFSGDDFQNTSLFPGTAEIRAEGPAGGEVITTFDGRNPFLLEGVRFDRHVWITAVPASPPDQALPTLMAFDTTQTDPVVVTLVRGLTLDSIYSVITTPITRTAGTGQVVLRFVNDAATPSPLSGVRATLNDAEARIYDTGGGFSDIESETGTLGLALFANVPAVASGSEHTVRIEGISSLSVKVRVAADTATFALIQLSP